MPGTGNVCRHVVGRGVYRQTFKCVNSELFPETHFRTVLHASTVFRMSQKFTITVPALPLDFSGTLSGYFASCVLWDDFCSAVGPGEDQHFDQQEDQHGSNQPFPEVAAPEAGSFDADRFVRFQPAVTLGAGSFFESQSVQCVELRFFRRTVESEQRCPFNSLICSHVSIGTG
jgi:hypothetical protein